MREPRVVASHGITEEQAVPPREIATAIQRKQHFDQRNSNRLHCSGLMTVTSARTRSVPPSSREEVLHAEIARKIYDLRTKAGLSQRELAKNVGTTASSICRLEDADYDGHSLFMLQRIAEALEKRVEIGFVSAKPLQSALSRGSTGKPSLANKRSKS
jgi:ribosome-binding protein aMBF1 (putative translation factor)